MGKVNIKDLVAGMVLASDTRDRAGKLLLPKGTELSDKSIHIFKMWGVLEADIVGHERDTAATRAGHDLTPEAIAKIRAELDQIFKFNDVNHPAVRELKRISLARRMKIAAASDQQ